MLSFLLPPSLCSPAPGHVVAQLKLLFQPILPYGGSCNSIYAYVKLFKPPPNCSSWQREGYFKHVTDDDVEMYRVVRHLEGDGTHRGRIVDIRSIWRPIQLVPVFGERCPSEWTSETAVDLAADLYVNSFMNKSTYYSVI